MSNPSLTAYAVSGDGIVRNDGAGPWSTLRAASTGTVASQFNPNDFGHADGTPGSLECGRAFFAFDLSSIPAGAKILSATLSLYVTSKTSGAGGSVGVVEGMQASTTTLTTADFGSVGSTEFASRINFSAFTTNAYNDYALNASGLAYLQSKVGSTAKLATRSSFDLDNTAPGSSLSSLATCSMSEQSGTSQDPKLVVVYSLDRAGADTISFTDGGVVTDTFPVHRRTGADSVAFTDAGVLTYLRSTGEVQVWPEGANTYLTVGGTLGSTVTVNSTSGFASSGTIWAIDNTKSTNQQAFATYTGKTSTTFTGCSWTSVIGRSTYGDGSLNFDVTVTGISAPDAETHFPQVISLDAPGTVNPELVISATQHAGHAALNGCLVFRRSTDGGRTWGSQEYIRSTPANGSGWGIFGHTLLRLKNGRIWASWYEHQLNYGVADSILVIKQMMSYSDDRMVSWSSPVAIPLNFGYSNTDGACGFGSYLDTTAGSNSTYGDIYLPIFGNPDGIYNHSTGEPSRGEIWLFKITDGGASGTATKVAEIFKPSNTGNRSSGEGDIVRAADGTYIMHARIEPKNASPDFGSPDERNRWQSTASSLAGPWSTPAKVISGFANGAALEVLPGGTLISTGSPILGSDAHPGQTGSASSSDNGVTWTRAIKYEALDATYTVYNGADTEVIINDSSVQVNTVFAYAQERLSQTGARTMFRWYVDPIKRGADSISFTDAATRAAQSFARTGADTITFTDTAARQGNALSKTGADTITFSDTASHSAASLARTGADLLTFGDGTVIALVPYIPPPPPPPPPPAGSFVPRLGPNGLWWEY